jgi:hypothetical protein
MIDAELQGLIESLEEVKTDSTVPKNVKSKIQEIITVLKDDSLELSIKVDKAQAELEEISSDTNIQSFTRTQLWNIVSMLETLL